jgi:predicted kinase
MQLIVFTGLPGSGKSTLAEALGRAIGVPVFSKDWLDVTVLNAGLDLSDTQRTQLGLVGYALLTTLARHQLALGQGAILDSIAGRASVREHWRALAAAHAAPYQIVECICSDPLLHRRRVEGRVRGIPGRPELDWAEVERVRAAYEPWDEERLVVDTVQPLSALQPLVLHYLADGARPTEMARCNTIRVAASVTASGLCLLVDANVAAD